MPDDVQLTDRHRDPYAWALQPAARLRRGTAGLKVIDAAVLGDFLEERANDILATVRCQKAAQRSLFDAAIGCLGC